MLELPRSRAENVGVESSLSAEMPGGVAAVTSAASRIHVRADGERLESIQLLRAAAALAVIGWHLVRVARAFPGALPRMPHALAFGYAGVDLFFAISRPSRRLVLSYDAAP